VLIGLLAQVASRRGLDIGIEPVEYFRTSSA
jgi:hypothetical protein